MTVVSSLDSSQQILPVKVCGITRLEDGLMAVESGAAALGFIFYPPSPRFKAPEMVADLIESIREKVSADFKAVGVFVDAATEEMNSISAQCGLDWIQLHGSEPAEIMTELNTPSYRAFRMKEVSEVAIAEEAPDEMILLDTYDPDHYGGTGKPFNWEWAKRISKNKKVILAGGLTPENVARASQAVSPAGLDLSSGVEVSPGIKDAAKVAAFFQALREVGFSGASPWSV